MNRIVIVEGRVSSLSHVINDKFSVAVDQSDRVPDFRIEITPEQADQIGASFREPVRVVLEIGAQDVMAGALSSREELMDALAASREIANEARREVDRLNRRLESLLRDSTAFDPEKHIAKADAVLLLEADAAACDAAAGRTSGKAREAYQACAEDTRRIIESIRDHKENP